MECTEDLHYEKKTLRIYIISRYFNSSSAQHNKVDNTKTDDIVNK